MGYDNSFKPDFVVEKDNWGVNNIVMKETNRRIRVVGDFESSMLNKIEPVKPNDEITIHDISEYHLDCNPKNMNLIIFTSSKSKHYRKRRVSLPFDNDDALLYLTVNTNRYKLVNYILHDGAKIVQTYRHDDKDKSVSYVGCAIVFNHNTEDAKKGIVSCLLYDTTDNNYYIVVVNIDKDINTITYDRYSITDPSNIGIDSGKMVTSVYDNLVKNLGKGISFKISDSDKIITNYIITNRDDIPDEYIDDNIDQVSVIKVNDDDIITSDDKKSTEYSKELEDNLTNTILKDNVRALTTVGVKIPKDFCSKFKILYLFVYDEKTGSKCIKSV